GVGLQEQSHEEIFREELIRPNHVDPRALPLRVWGELQTLERVLGRKRGSHLVTRQRGPQKIIRIEVAAQLQASCDRLILSCVVPEIEANLPIPEVLLEALELLRPGDLAIEPIAELHRNRLVDLPAPQHARLAPVDVVVRIVTDLFE